MTLVAPASPTTAGMPSERTRMTVWCVGPPTSQTRPRTRLQSSWAAMDGGSSSATSISGGSSSRIEIDQRVAIGPEAALQPRRHVGQVAGALAKPRVALAREQLVELGDGALERPVGVDALGAHELIGPPREQRIVQHQQLRREDGGLGRADRAGHAGVISSSSRRVRSRALRRRCRSRSTPLDASRYRTCRASRTATSARPTAIPGETPRPTQARHGSSNPRDGEVAQRRQRVGFVRAFGRNRELRAAGGRQQQQAQDALAVDDARAARRP